MTLQDIILEQSLPLIQEGFDQLIVRILEDAGIEAEGKTITEINELLKEQGLSLVADRTIPKHGMETLRTVILLVHDDQREIVAGGEYSILFSSKKMELKLEVSLYKDERLALENELWKEYDEKNE